MALMTEKLRAIMALNVLTGQLGRPGAGVFVRPGLAFPTTSARLQRPDLVPPGTRSQKLMASINMSGAASRQPRTNAGQTSRKGLCARGVIAPRAGRPKPGSRPGPAARQRPGHRPVPA